MPTLVSKKVVEKVVVANTKINIVNSWALLKKQLTSFCMNKKIAKI